MRRFGAFMLCVPLLAACSSGGGASVTRTPSPPAATVSFGDPPDRPVLHVWVADTEAERERGLMGRTSLPEDQGMVFVFGGQTTARFWMKDTLIPLSIAFYDGDGVVAIMHMQPCEADPCPTYGPDVPYVGAVEANEGWFERNGVETGDRVELDA